MNRSFLLNTVFINNTQNGMNQLEYLILFYKKKKESKSK